MTCQPTTSSGIRRILAHAADSWLAVHTMRERSLAHFLDAQQQFNFTLMERFAEIGIEFAYPTQTIYTKVVG